MGRGVEDVQDELKLFPFRLADDLVPGEVLRIKLGERTYTPPEISAYILRQLKRNAERFFSASGQTGSDYRPRLFQRRAAAGHERCRTHRGPRCVAPGERTNGRFARLRSPPEEERNHRRLRSGGGTFDISILKLRDGIFEVMATNGDTHLGGDDIDNLLIAIALDDIHGDLGLDFRQHGEAVQSIRQAVIDAKIALSANLAAAIGVTLPDGHKYQREITREQFEQLIRPVIERTASPCKQAMKDAGLKPEQIDEVVLVGGSTRIPLVRQLVRDLFNASPHCELNPDEVVALGAAVQANILAGGSQATEDMLLLDVTPLSLGIEALGGVVARIIHRNSTIPASATEHFTTGVDGQTSVAIHVVQGERELAKDCRSLARFDLKGVPPMPAGLAADRSAIPDRRQRNPARLRARAAQRQGGGDRGAAQLRTL